MSRRERERRSVPFSALLDSARQPSEPSVDPARFFPRESEYPGQWAIPPSPWPDPEQRLLSKETVERVRVAIDGVAPAQREVIVLRDVEGWSSREVCNFPGISETNQRVLLHRARTKVRQALDGYLQGSEPSERRRA